MDHITWFILILFGSLALYVILIGTYMIGRIS